MNNLDLIKFNNINLIKFSSFLESGYASTRLHHHNLFLALEVLWKVAMQLHHPNLFIAFTAICSCLTTKLQNGLHTLYMPMFLIQELSLKNGAWTLFSSLQEWFIHLPAVLKVVDTHSFIHIFCINTSSRAYTVEHAYVCKGEGFLINTVYFENYQLPIKKLWK